MLTMLAVIETLQYTKVIRRLENCCCLVARICVQTVHPDGNT